MQSSHSLTQTSHGAHDKKHEQHGTPSTHCSTDETNSHNNEPTQEQQTSSSSEQSTMSYGWSHSGTALTPTQRHAALARDRHTCRTCGDTATEVDHIINLAQGGTHDPVHLHARTTRCNRSQPAAEARTATQAARAARYHPAEAHPGIT